MYSTAPASKEVEKKTTKTERRLQMAARARAEAQSLGVMAVTIEHWVGRSRFTEALRRAAATLYNCAELLPPTGSVPVVKP